MAKYEEGKMDEESFAEAGFKAIVEGTKKVAIPFVSEAIFTKAVSDVYFAAKSESGETPDGKRVFDPNDSFEDRVADSGYHILDSFIPGTVLGIDRIITASDEERDFITGEIKYDLENEFSSFASGVRWTEWKPEVSLNYRISEYKDTVGTITPARPDYNIPFGDYVQDYKNRQQRRYAAQKELYRSIQASQYFRDDADIRKQLIDRGLSKDETVHLMNGYFKPEEINSKLLTDIRNKVGNSPEATKDIRAELSEVYADMSQTLLNTPTEED